MSRIVNIRNTLSATRSLYFGD